MTKIDIINETVKFYNLTNRGFGVGSCMYLTEEGNMCAVGRCMINPKDTQLKFGSGSIRGIACKMNNIDRTISKIELDTMSVDHLLKPEYHGHNVEFWSDIQTLHDSYNNWNDDGLTEAGQKVVNELLIKY